MIFITKINLSVELRVGNCKESVIPTIFLSCYLCVFLYTYVFLTAL